MYIADTCQNVLGSIQLIIVIWHYVSENNLRALHTVFKVIFKKQKGVSIFFLVVTNMFFCVNCFFLVYLLSIVIKLLIDILKSILWQYKERYTAKFDKNT